MIISPTLPDPSHSVAVLQDDNILTMTMIGGIASGEKGLAMTLDNYGFVITRERTILE